MNSLDAFHPTVRRWFEHNFDTPTPVQQASWPVVAGGEHALITAPTGSGKTLTAFLWSLSQFAAGGLETGSTKVLYVSPLKALNNDIQQNLLMPLTELVADYN
ncbi:MAG: DEAD/DEAH box helicase, partial [Pseudomonadota bacterium]|nr:DEAD/DEAH box helicase [Pseudomonadota bacterium]